MIADIQAVKTATRDCHNPQFRPSDGIQNAHPGYSLEKRIHRGFSVGRRWQRHTGQTFLNRTLKRGFDIFADQAGKPLRELVSFVGTVVHGPSIVTRAEAKYHHWRPPHDQQKRRARARLFKMMSAPTGSYRTVTGAGSGGTTVGCMPGIGASCA